ncbi:MAG: hypothetical protein IJ956_07505, partial [Akkermansia sp.]|nr:hypothetical protein [Akkermansia sp.]
MKRNLYLIAAGLVLCSCTEPGDVVTGYARIITKNQPVVSVPVAKPSPVSAPVAAPAPAPTPMGNALVTGIVTKIGLEL